MQGALQVAEACAERTFLTSIASSVLCEALACSALDRYEDCVREYHRLCAPGLGFVGRWAACHPDAVRVVPPQGTPFAWIQRRTGESSLALCRRALEAGLLLTPGETMGSEAGFRLGFTRDVDTVTEGLRRLGPRTAAGRAARRGRAVRRLRACRPCSGPRRLHGPLFPLLLGRRGYGFGFGPSLGSGPGAGAGLVPSHRT